MPYKHEKLHIPLAKDRRAKLSIAQKTDIKEMYETGNFSQRQLARLFEVSRRTIQFIVNPEALEENLKRRQERGGSAVYYDKQTNTSTMKEHRRYKQKLYLKGELIK